MSLRKNYGFTLIELLVVVAIILLLVAISMPSMAQAMAVSQQAVCASGTHQVHVAWQSRLFDDHGKLFGYRQPTGLLWVSQLRTHISDPDAFICPSTDNPAGREGIGKIGIGNVRMGNARLAWIEARWGDLEPWDRASFTYNTALTSENSLYYNPGDRYQSLSAIDSPARVPVVGDGTWREAHPGDPKTGATNKLFPPNLNAPEGTLPSGADYAFRYATNRHGHTTNLVYADGHVGMIPLVQLWSQKWHRNYNTTTPVSGAP